MTTELAPIERAKQVLSFDETKAKLADLAVQSVRIVEITTPAGYQEAQRARVELKATRVDIQKRGKAAREDATAYSKAVIEAENDLIAVIEPEESRLQELHDAWDAAREAERQAKINAEREAQRKAEEDARRAEVERQREADRIARQEAEAKAKAEREARAAAEQERIAMVIANATLAESAREAVELLEDNGLGEHLVTRKLRAAIERMGYAA